ncbi:MAG: DUF4381 family protein [Verrucomicrobiales bacterium]|nr:DUF4381 family protein [Verrucomicrobiales bacterium]
MAGLLALAVGHPLLAATLATNGATVPQQLHDIRGPIDIRSPWMWARVGLVLAIVGGLLAAAWWWWRRRSPAAHAAFVESPADRARKRLTEAMDLMHDPERFATRVSEVVRTYLEERFGLRAPERTTEEFLAELATSVALEARHKALLAEFLTECDLAKFARAEPGPAELEQLQASAFRLVDETAPVVASTDTPVAGGRREAP